MLICERNYALPQADDVIPCASGLAANATPAQPLSGNPGGTFTVHAELAPVTSAGSQSKTTAALDLGLAFSSRQCHELRIVSEEVHRVIEWKFERGSHDY